MIEFMVLAMPRSGTGWCANWLTTDRTLCLHDPLWKHHYSELDNVRSPGRRLGVSCTGLAMFPDFLASHRARKVILHRPIAEVNESGRALGLDPIPTHWDSLLDSITGFHASWTDVFKPETARPIYEFLLQRSFDEQRHAMLTGLNVQIAFERVKPDPRVARRFFEEFRRAGERLQ